MCFPWRPWFWSIYSIYHLGNWNKVFPRDIYISIIGVANYGVFVEWYDSAINSSTKMQKRQNNDSHVSHNICTFDPYELQHNVTSFGEWAKYIPSFRLPFSYFMIENNKGQLSILFPFLNPQTKPKNRNMISYIHFRFSFLYLAKKGRKYV